MTKHVNKEKDAAEAETRQDELGDLAESEEVAAGNEVDLPDAEAETEAQLESPAESDADAEFADPGPAVDAAATRPRRSFMGLAALFLSLVALAGVAYLYLTAESVGDLEFASPGDVAETRSSVDALAASVEALDGRMEALAGIESSTESARSRLEATLKDEIEALDSRLSMYDSLPPRVGNLENSVAAIQGIEAGARDTLLLAEAEHYLKLANSLLTLGSDVELAGVALGMADDRVASIGNPALNNVRQSISDSMTALELAAAVDMERNAMLLASLSSLVDSLPLQPVEGEAEIIRDGTDAADEENTATQAWNSVREAVFSAVKVTRPGGERTPLLMPGTQPLIRANLSLQLQAARLALLRGVQEIFDQSLEDADAWIEQSFDTDSEQVASARTTLGEIRSMTMDTELPDISEPLTLLRQYISLAESAP